VLLWRPADYGRVDRTHRGHIIVLPSNLAVTARCFLAASPVTAPLEISRAADTCAGHHAESAATSWTATLLRVYVTGGRAHRRVPLPQAASSKTPSRPPAAPARGRPGPRQLAQELRDQQHGRARVGEPDVRRRQRDGSSQAQREVPLPQSQHQHGDCRRLDTLPGSRRDARRILSYDGNWPLQSIEESSRYRPSACAYQNSGSHQVGTDAHYGHHRLKSPPGAEIARSRRGEANRSGAISQSGLSADLPRSTPQSPRGR